MYAPLTQRTRRAHHRVRRLHRLDRTLPRREFAGDDRQRSESDLCVRRLAAGPRFALHGLFDAVTALDARLDDDDGLLLLVDDHRARMGRAHYDFAMWGERPGGP